MSTWEGIHVWLMRKRERTWSCDSIHAEYLTARRVFDSLEAKSNTRAVVLVDHRGRPLDIYTSAKGSRVVVPH